MSRLSWCAGSAPILISGGMMPNSVPASASSVMPASGSAAEAAGFFSGLAFLRRWL